MRRWMCVTAALGAVVACSLTTDLSGFSDPVAIDAGSMNDGGMTPETSVPDSTVPDAPVDALPACVATTTLDTPLTSTLGTWSPRKFQINGYPKVETFFGSPAAVLLPFVDTTPVPIDAGDPDAGPTFFVPPEQVSAISGLWQLTRVPLRAFDIQLDFRVNCTKAGSCADGLGIAWVDAAALAAPNMNDVGGAEGFPEAVSGGGVIVDDYRNDSTGSSDPPVPALEIVKLDATKLVGKYPWVVSTVAVDFRGAWHTLTISVRGSSVTVGYDGKQSFIGTVPMVASGLVGITAGTGGQTDAVAVRNVKASFYDCMPP